MIASVRGTVLSATETTAIVEVGGVGLEISVTPAHARGLRVGSEATMRTALIVREDDLSLYGFANAEGRAVFDLLRGVSGVGPKSAMGVLAAMEPHEIAAAVVTEDDAAFRRVSGIGQKTAKLIVVSLAGSASVRVRRPSGGVGQDRGRRHRARRAGRTRLVGTHRHPGAGQPRRRGRR